MEIQQHDTLADNNYDITMHRFVITIVYCLTYVNVVGR